MTAPGRRRWVILGISAYAQAVQATLANGSVFLIPSLQDTFDIGLVRAGLITSMPVFGSVVGMYPWGAAADRWGERLVLVLGSAGAALVLIAGTVAPTVTGLSVALFVAGVGCSSSYASTGRMIIAWFGPRQRGMAMGVRQTAVPLGIASSAIALPALAAAHGPAAALRLTAVLLLTTAVVCGVGVIDRDPAAGPTRLGGTARSPYAADRWLVRLHLSSALLVIPQFVVWTFSLVWLLDEAGVSPTTAGVLVASMHILGAGGRLGAGVLSDRLGLRIKPLLWVSVLIGVTLFAFAGAATVPSVLAVGLLVVASVLVISPNALAYTAAAEAAGDRWAGRVLGIHNTGQSILAASVGPVFGYLIETIGYPATFAVAGSVGIVAAMTLPDERAPARADRLTPNPTSNIVPM